MDGLEIFVFVLVGLLWLAIWIIRIFRKAFNQPTTSFKKDRPVVSLPDVIISETIRQHKPKTEKEILERSQPPVARSLEVPQGSSKTLEAKKGSGRSLETLTPMGRSMESALGEATRQREDIVEQRREKTVYQKGKKQPVSVFAKMLQNPENARNAVVLAEILKRKF